MIFDKYEPLPKGAKEYKKIATCHAVQINEPFVVNTKEGEFTAKKGDYLVKGVDGENYSCDKEIFEKSYEEVEVDE